MEIIRKEKKTVFWVGLPSSNGQSNSDPRQLLEMIREKDAVYERLRSQHMLYQALLARNSKRAFSDWQHRALRVPFIIIKTSKHTNVHAQRSDSGSDCYFELDDTFALHDDQELLAQIDSASK
jgi:hypothetical protein